MIRRNFHSRNINVCHALCVGNDASNVMVAISQTCS